MDATRHGFKRYRVKISGGGNNSLYVEGLLVLTEKFVVVLSKVGGGRWMRVGVFDIFTGNPVMRIEP